MKVFAVISLMLCSLGFAVGGQETAEPGRIQYGDFVEIVSQQQYAAVRPGSKSAIAIHFDLNKNWHFYADGKTAPGQMNLKIRPLGEGVSFSEPMFPPSETYFDKSSGQRLEVYSHKFTVFVPFEVEQVVADEEVTIDIKIGIEGAMCSANQCQSPSFGHLASKIKVRPDAAMDKAAFEVPAFVTSPGQSTPVLFALLLAFVAGLALNIMPCVWPMIPIVVMRLLNQADKSRARSVGLGLAFCGGILLFFVGFAVVNIVLRAGFDVVFQWGDHYRNPAFVMAMVLLMVVLAMFMFGVFNVAVPAFVTSKAKPGKGYLGSVGMGFLAAILATPCSFAILTAAFAWAQTQPLSLSTLAIILIGVGMAAPYAILTSIPFLLQRLPKPGRWTEMFKQGLGFVMLIVAVKLLEALPEHLKMGTLYCAAVLGFCVWMWGAWVSYEMSSMRRRAIRLIAIAVAAGAVLWFLPEKQGLIEWQSYDAAMVSRATKNQKPVLLEFMADWCFSCKVVEKTVYNRENIAALIENKGVLAVRADTTSKDYPATIDLRDIYREPAVPVSILLIPGRAELVRLRGVLIGKKLKEELEKLPDSKPEQ